ncbi:hypothetical protein A1Q2_07524 [Trichosporon asahii var. asahii CBS 8904]|uniref:C2H2-type domain-containing protein n=1 Tax=Trichosporon asahii var. asahii (strain CBS 8904) TaxID=1220162 RepID=K1VNF4_TRIAC|nr:hypothetical protein A1Q2_07524 [Trichosporon asahii var. asahii CBS 8904]
MSSPAPSQQSGMSGSELFPQPRAKRQRVAKAQSSKREKSKRKAVMDEDIEEKSSKKRAVEGDDSRPSPVPVDDAQVEHDDDANALDGPSLRTYLHHHSRLLVKIYEALVKQQSGQVNMQEMLSAMMHMKRETGRLYVSSNYLTNPDNILGKFPVLSGKVKPTYRGDGLSRLDDAEVPELYEEITELSRGGTWKCPNDGCGVSFEIRTELRDHMK